MVLGQSCPSGWIAETSVANKCVQIVNQTQPWFGANFDCSAYGSNASLLSISNAFENAEILSKFLVIDPLVANLGEWERWEVWMSEWALNVSRKKC
jgi:hypothetical protein